LLFLYTRRLNSSGMSLSSTISAEKTRIENDGGTVESGLANDLIDPIYQKLNSAGEWSNVETLAAAGARSSVSGAVETLYDWSGNARDLVQGDSTKRPAEVTLSKYNNHVTLDFDGEGDNDDVLDGPALSSDVPQPITYLLMAQPGGFHTDGRPGEPRMALYGPGPESAAARMFSAGSGLAVGTFFVSGEKAVVGAGVFDGASSHLYQNGHESLSVDPGSNAFGGLRFGRAQGGFATINDNAMMVLVVSSALPQSLIKDLSRIPYEYYLEFDVWDNVEASSFSGVTNPVIDKNDAGVQDFVADPHLVEDGGTFYAFYEQKDGTPKSIAYATSTDGKSWTHQGTALSVSEDNLSHPHVFRNSSQWYMTPFGADSGVTLFETTDANFPTGWTKSSTLFDLAASEKDPVPFEHNGHWYCFFGEGGAGLALYEASSLTGTWSRHPVQNDDGKLATGDTYESPAGGIIRYSNGLLLPVSNSQGGSGINDVSLLRIETLTPTALNASILPIGAIVEHGQFGSWTETGMHAFDLYAPNSENDDFTDAFALVDGKNNSNDWSVGTLDVSTSFSPAISGVLEITDAAESISATGQTRVSAALSLTDLAESVSLSGGSTITTGTASVTDRGEILSLEGQATVNAITGTLSITNGPQSVSLSGATENEGSLSVTDAGEVLSLEGESTVTAITGTLFINDAGESVSLSGATENEGTLNLTDRGERLVLLESQPPRLAVLDARLTDALTLDATLTD
jgi:hypothetical protein